MYQRMPQTASETEPRMTGWLRMRYESAWRRLRRRSSSGRLFFLAESLAAARAGKRGLFKRKKNENPEVKD